MNDDEVRIYRVKVLGEYCELLSYTKYLLPGDKAELQILEFMDLDNLYKFYRELLKDKAKVSYTEALSQVVNSSHWGFCIRSYRLIAYTVLQDENYSANKIEVLTHELDHLLRPANSLEESELSAARTGFMAKAAFNILAESNKQAIELVGADMIHVRGTI